MLSVYKHHLKIHGKLSYTIKTNKKQPPKEIKGKSETKLQGCFQD